jgi:hypothetical protein
MTTVQSSSKRNFDWEEMEFLAENRHEHGQAFSTAPIS